MLTCQDCGGDWQRRGSGVTAVVYVAPAGLRRVMLASITWPHSLPSWLLATFAEASAPYATYPPSLRCGGSRLQPGRGSAAYDARRDHASYPLSSVACWCDTESTAPARFEQAHREAPVQPSRKRLQLALLPGWGTLGVGALSGCGRTRWGSAANLRERRNAGGHLPAERGLLPIRSPSAEALPAPCR
jgi:hypothetical protein